MTVAVCVYLSTYAQGQLKLTKIREYDGPHRGSFAPDGNRVALVTDAEIKIVNIQSGRIACKFRVPGKVALEPEFDSAAFSLDGKTLAASYATYDGKDFIQSIVFYDADKCSVKRTINGEPTNNAGKYLSFSSNGRLFAASADVSRVWDISNGAEIYRESPADGFSVKETLISSDGRWLVTYGQKFVAPETLGRLFVTDLTTKETRLLISDWVLQFAFSRDHKKLFVNVLGSRDARPNVRAYDVGTWKILNQFVSAAAGRSFAVSPDGMLLAGGYESPFAIVSAENGTTLAEASHYKRTEADDLADRMHMITFLDQVEFSSDGKMLLTGGEDGSVKIWRLDFDKN
jgi:WD40 repeat protein